MGFVADIFGGGNDAPPPPKPKPEPVRSPADVKDATTRAKTGQKKRRARLAAGRGLLSGGFKGYGDNDKLGG